MFGKRFFEGGKKDEKVELNEVAEALHTNLSNRLDSAAKWSIDINQRDLLKLDTELKVALRELLSMIGDDLPSEYHSQAQVVPHEFVKRFGDNENLLTVAAPLFQNHFNSPVVTDALVALKYG